MPMPQTTLDGTPLKVRSANDLLDSDAKCSWVDPDGRHGDTAAESCDNYAVVAVRFKDGDDWTPWTGACRRHARRPWLRDAGEVRDDE
jgi:hypothetical protein